jgi:hypothetical protein
MDYCWFATYIFLFLGFNFMENELAIDVCTYIIIICVKVQFFFFDK